MFQRTKTLFMFTKQTSERLSINSVDVILLLFLMVCYDTQVKGQCIPKDCLDLRCYRISKGLDGPHTVYPGFSGINSEIQVSCDQIVNGGGWTAWLRRKHTSDDMDFVQTWEDYKRGFGENSHETEFYLGNEIVHKYTTNYSNANGELRIDGVGYDDTIFTLAVDKFSLSNEADGYAMRMGTEYDNINVAKETLLAHKDRNFSIADNNCGTQYGAGYWWFIDPSCAKFYMFGKHGETVPDGKPNFILSADSAERPLKQSRMLFRPYGFRHRCNNPCMNGATCHHVPDDNTYRCICPFSHCGRNCETANMCHFGGTCVYDETSPSNYSCICTEGFFGPTCNKTQVTTKDVFHLSPRISGAIFSLAIPLLILIIAIYILCLRNNKNDNAAAKAPEAANADNFDEEEMADDDGWGFF